MISPKPVIVLGTGGHGRVVMDTLQVAGREVLFAIDENHAGKIVLGVSIKASNDEVQQYAPDAVELVIGIGDQDVREKLFKKFKDLGYVFASVVHPATTLAADVMLGEGCQIMAGGIIQTGSVLADNVVVNTGARIDHDARLDSLVFIAPGAVLCGAVSVGRKSFIGAGATVLPKIRIGAETMVGGAALVNRDIDGNCTVVGVPARRMP